MIDNECKATPPHELLTAHAAALVEATKRYEGAKCAESTASSRATQALNDMNAAQRAFDKVVESLRKGAPSSSDWGTKNRGPHL